MAEPRRTTFQDIAMNFRMLRLWHYRNAELHMVRHKRYKRWGFLLRRRAIHAFDVSRFHTRCVVLLDYTSPCWHTTVQQDAALYENGSDLS
jgi:hypothetical protein